MEDNMEFFDMTDGKVYKYEIRTITTITPLKSGKEVYEHIATSSKETDYNEKGFLSENLKYITKEWRQKLLCAVLDEEIPLSDIRLNNYSKYEEALIGKQVYVLKDVKDNKIVAMGKEQHKLFFPERETGLKALQAKRYNEKQAIKDSKTK